MKKNPLTFCNGSSVLQIKCYNGFGWINFMPLSFFSYIKLLKQEQNHWLNSLTKLKQRRSRNYEMIFEKNTFFWKVNCCFKKGEEPLCLLFENAKDMNFHFSFFCVVIYSQCDKIKLLIYRRLKKRNKCQRITFKP